MVTKIQVHSICEELIKEKVTVLNNELASAQAGANDNTKSSAGDKHETGRAQAQLATEQLGKQLNEMQKQLTMLSSFNSAKNLTSIQGGALVKTSKGLFYISTSIGQVKVQNNVVFVISTLAPIAQQMIGLKVGDSFLFNGVRQTIASVA